MSVIEVKCGIYKIVNKINSKFYIGSSKDIYGRFYKHTYLLKKNEHENNFLQNSFNKYGESAFCVEIVELCEEEKLIEKEQLYIDVLSPDYNFVKVAGKPPSAKGRKVSEETKEKHRVAQTGKKIPYKARPNSSGANNYAFGKKRSEEIRIKISQSNLGKKRSEEVKKKISLAHIGICPSEETRKKISEAGLGRIQSLETRYKRSKSNTGKKHSEETKEKISISRIGHKLAEETKKKISISLSGKKRTLEAIEKTAESKRIPIVGINKKTGETREFMSLTSAADTMGVNKGDVWRVLKNQRKYAGGYGWKYKETSEIKEITTCQ